MIQKPETSKTKNRWMILIPRVPNKIQPKNSLASQVSMKTQTEKSQKNQSRDSDHGGGGRERMVGNVVVVVGGGESGWWGWGRVL